MDAILQSNSIDLGKLLEEHKGGDVVVLDMRSLNFWTDFFVIATVTSSTHLSGMERHVKEFAAEREMEILHRSGRPGKNAGLHSDEWQIFDLGSVVVHLMSAKLRSFFELERLWGAAPRIYQSGAQDHSSKSS